MALSKHWIKHIEARQSDRLSLVERLLVGAYQRRSALGRTLTSALCHLHDWSPLQFIVRPSYLILIHKEQRSDSIRSFHYFQGSAPEVPHAGSPGATSRRRPHPARAAALRG